MTPVGHSERVRVEEIARNQGDLDVRLPRLDVADWKECDASEHRESDRDYGDAQ